MSLADLRILQPGLLHLICQKYPDIENIISADIVQCQSYDVGSSSSDRDTECFMSIMLIEQSMIGSQLYHCPGITV
jgi:hypothetical protein